MKITHAFLMAFSSLKSNKMRAFLTMLGMIIGVAAVIAMISILDGYMGYQMQSFKDMGVDTLTVNLSDKGKRPLTDDDMYGFVSDHSEYFKEVTPMASMTANIRIDRTLKREQQLTGVAENYAEIKGFKTKKGRFLSYSDMKILNKVCVLGTYTAKEYFGNEDPLGKSLKINHVEYKVVGLLDEKADSSQYSEDDCTLIPYTVATRAARCANPQTYCFKMLNTDVEKPAQQALENFLYSHYRSQKDYQVMNMASMLDMLEKECSIIEKIMVGIAGISLLVAGIGIMNIMLVSVSERTREIGIRKSLGARQHDIMSQFVIEAAVLSSIGGLIGIAIGGAMTTLIGNLLIGVNCSPSMKAIVVSFSVSAGIGLLFGYMPAKRAARLNPIDALRSE